MGCPTLHSRLTAFRPYVTSHVAQGRTELRGNLLGNGDLRLREVGEVENHEGILQGAIAEVLQGLYVRHRLRTESGREATAYGEVTLDLTRLDGANVFLDPPEEAKQLPEGANKTVDG